MKFRIISNGDKFLAQYKYWYWPFTWFTCQRPEDLDNKDFGGDKSFESREKAQEHIDEITPKVWKVV